MQAMPQLTDRSKLPNIVDPVIKDTMDLKHLYQVCEPKKPAANLNYWMQVSNVKNLFQLTIDY